MFNVFCRRLNRRHPGFSITLILVAIGMTAGFSETLNTVTFWAAIITVFALTITVLVAWLQYVFFRYSLGEDIIKIHRGVLTKEEIAIPLPAH